MKNRLSWIVLALLAFSPACVDSGEQKPRLVMFIGADISGSFLRGPHFEDSLDFLARYIHGHLNGYGGMEVPHELFVGSIGGDKPDEPKTLYPIQTFENKSIDQIRQTLAKIFPKNRSNPFTDYNAFFEQIANTITNRKLILKPVSIVMISDGKPDAPSRRKGDRFRAIQLKPLENLSRNITLRLLYTDAVTGMGWQTKIPRRRVKVWTQDAKVMQSWKANNIYDQKKTFKKQARFFDWVHENVDFPVRPRRVQ